MLMYVVAGVVLLYLVVSIARDMPAYRKAMCEQGKAKCGRCNDRFRCYTHR